MDTSEQYIKMCDWPEIQIKTPEDGVGGTHIDGNIWYHTQSQWSKQNDLEPDGYYWQMDENYTEKCETCGNEEQKHRTVKCIWLPRQDQLQAMITFNNPFDMLACFWVWVSKQYNQLNCPYNSIEQLWLAFVMKEKFNKVWTGTEWI